MKHTTMIVVSLLCLAMTLGAQSAVSMNAAGDYVIRFEADGVPQEVIFERATHIRPEVRVQVTMLPNPPRFQYRYRVANGPGARQEIHSFTLRDVGSGPVMDSPPEWEGADVPQRGRVYWLRRAKDRKRGIPPNAAVDGFAVQSSLLPGPTSAELRGTTDAPRIPRVIPRSAQLQLEKLMSQDYVTVGTIGPVIRGFTRDEPELSVAVFLARMKNRFSAPMMRAEHPDITEIMRIFDETIARAESGLVVDTGIRTLVSLATKRADSNWINELNDALVINLQHALSQQ